MEKFEDEYDPSACVLNNGKPCDNECPYFMECPIADFDIAQGIFIKRVIDIAKEKK